MNKYIKENTSKCGKPKDITFHYTSDSMVLDLINLIKFKNGDRVLDAGSGKNKIWFNNIPKNCFPLECEIEDGIDFLNKEYAPVVEWVIGNPPFSIGWNFLDKATDIALEGVAFLGNINFFNCLNQNRLQKLKDKGFYINKIHVVSDKRWYGRYYFIIFSKQDGGVFSWNNKSY